MMTRSQQEALEAEAIALPHDRFLRALATAMEHLDALKASRARDLSDAIDRLTVLAAIHTRRYGQGFTHRNQTANVNSSGELWVTRLCPARIQPKPEASRSTDAAMVESQRRQRQERVLLEASRRLHDRGTPLTTNTILCEAKFEAEGLLDAYQVANTIARLRKKTKWPFGALANATPRTAKLMRAIAQRPRVTGTPEPEPEPEPEPADETNPIVQWVALPEYPEFEGTPCGRCREIPTGRELRSTSTHKHYGVRRADGAKTTATPVKISKIVCRVLGCPLPPGVDGRHRRWKGATTHQAWPTSAAASNQ